MPLDAPKITIDDDYIDLRKINTFRDLEYLRSACNSNKKRPLINRHNAKPRKENSPPEKCINIGLTKDLNKLPKNHEPRKKNLHREMRHYEIKEDSLKSLSDVSMVVSDISGKTYTVFNNAAYLSRAPMRPNVPIKRKPKYMGRSIENSNNRQSKNCNVRTTVNTINGANNFKKAGLKQNTFIKQKENIMMEPKKSNTFPIFQSNCNPNLKKNYCDFDRETYLYDESSEMGSSCIAKDKPVVSNLLKLLISALGSLCGIFLVSALVYIVFCDNLMEIMFEPKENTELCVKYYIKVIGGGIIHGLTSIFSTIIRILSIPVVTIQYK